MGQPLQEEWIRSVDCVAILVAHSRVDYEMVLRNARAVFDAVNATTGRGGGALVERL